MRNVTNRDRMFERNKTAPTTMSGSRSSAMPTRLPRHSIAGPVRRHIAPPICERDYGIRWQRLAKMVLSADPLCTDPFDRHGGAPVPATQVDHIVPVRAGGSDERSNLQPLCASCHSYKTARHDGGFGRAMRPMPPPGAQVRCEPWATGATRGDRGAEEVARACGTGVLPRDTFRARFGYRGGPFADVASHATGGGAGGGA